MFLCRPEKMAKRSRNLVLGFLLLPLFYAVFLRSSVSNNNHNSSRFQLSYWPSSLNLISSESSGINGGEYMKFLIRSLVRGRARREVGTNGVSCVSGIESTLCVTTAAVRIATGDQPVIYFSAGQNLRQRDTFSIQPYPRQTDAMAMEQTKRITLVSDTSITPACDVTHPVPAMVFSTGGFAGNFFHDINDVIIPLFITTSPFRSRIQLVISDYKPYWFNKYRGVLTHVSAYNVIMASSPLVPVERKVHCFPGAVVGMKYHNNLACNSTETPGGVTTLDFKLFLHESFGLRNTFVPPAAKRPILVLISRRKSRALLNEDQVALLAEELGFHVELAPPWRMRRVYDFAELVNSCSVLMGVHGAGLTNMVFLPTNAVVLQVVPWGLDWASNTYYGVSPAARFGLKYVEYKSTVEESSLYYKYPKNHTVLTDPWAIHRQGYHVSKPIYTEGQNITVDVSRFRETLLQAMQLLPRPSLPLATGND